MKKVKLNIIHICKIFLLCSLLFFMTGCSSRECGITVETELPKQTQLHFLIKCSPNKQSENEQTEIAQYHEDDFLCADIWKAGAHISDDRLMFELSSSAQQLRESVQEYTEIRLAVTDIDGMILKVSPTFSLTVEGKNLFWDKINYDFASNQITGLDTTALDESHFINMLKWTGISFLSTLIFAIFGKMLIDKEQYTPENHSKLLGTLILFMFLMWMFRMGLYFIIVTAVLFLLNFIWKKILEVYPKAPIAVFPIFWFICGIPVRIMIYFQCEQFFMPYYQTGSFELSGVLCFMGICDLPWLMLSISLWRTFLKNYAEEKV